MIKRISYDFGYTVEAGFEDKRFTVGKRDSVHGKVVEIIEHRSRGEGDKWYYDIFFDSGEAIRTFNPNEIQYAPAEQIKEEEE